MSNYRFRLQRYKNKLDYQKKYRICCPYVTFDETLEPVSTAYVPYKGSMRTY